MTTDEKIFTKLYPKVPWNQCPESIKELMKLARIEGEKEGRRKTLIGEYSPYDYVRLQTAREIKKDLLSKNIFGYYARLTIIEYFKNKFRIKEGEGYED